MSDSPQSPAAYYRYWGKTGRAGAENDNYHLLPYHCLDVAACARQLVKQNQFGIAELLAKVGLGDDDGLRWFLWFTACHDIGKFANGFQKLVPHPNTPLVAPVARIIEKPPRHDSMGFWLWNDKLLERWRDKHQPLFPAAASGERARFVSVLDTWMKMTTGHHGKPPDTGAKSCILAFTDADIDAAASFLCDLNELFALTPLPDAWCSKAWRGAFKQHSWLLAGVITLADWLGSNERDFPWVHTPMPLAEYWQLACQRAEQALSKLAPVGVQRDYRGHQALFPFIDRLTPLQQRATSLDVTHTGPELVVLEDVTGAGKTEAALILAHRMMAAGKAQGLYVGLPTMATANAMYSRLARAYQALFADGARPSLVLAHGGWAMSDDFRQSLWQADDPGLSQYGSDNEETASGACNAWFADSRKKSLLAEVGVGTLDQVLMAVMPFRHQSLRLLGMHNKLLMLDEVHAYDGYMVKLLEGLLFFHAAQGGSAIILSATLPLSLRTRLLTAFSRGAGWQPDALQPDAGYPWLSHLSVIGLHEEPLETRREVVRRVAIDWLTTVDDGIEVIYRAVAAGECICWVRNTVDDAMHVFRRLQAEGQIAAQDLLLFHSRFAFGDRLAIETQTLGWFGSDAPAAGRRGKVLIATQVVEQSLDLDVDVMISDLAPIDLLIQRAGRLQRHIRDADGQRKSSLPEARRPPVLHILAPAWQPQPELGWLGEALRGTGFVYSDHACLWRTQKLLRELGEISMPDMARTLIEGVYGAEAIVPPGLETVANEVYSQFLSQRTIAGQTLLKRDGGYDRESSDFMWDEGREFSTRLSEPGTEVFLAWQDKHGQLHPAAADGDFRWERSRVQVRTRWWHKHSARFALPDTAQLEQVRNAIYRPHAELVLVDETGEAPYYSRQCGLIGDAAEGEDSGK